MKQRLKFVLLTIFFCTMFFFLESRFGKNGFPAMYSFESFITDGSSFEAQSTPAILLPDYLKKDGEYFCQNNTQNTIAVFTSTDGFLMLPPGEYILSGRPVAMFLIKPEDNLSACNGTFEISKTGSILNKIFTFRTTSQGVSANFKQKLKNFF